MSVPPLDRFAQLLQPRENEKTDPAQQRCKQYAAAAVKMAGNAKRAIDKASKQDAVAGSEAELEQAALLSSLTVVNAFSALVLTFERIGQPHNKAVQSAYEVLNRHHAAIKSGADNDALESVAVADIFGWEAKAPAAGGAHDGK